jgi:hypothetical protein
MDMRVQTNWSPLSLLADVRPPLDPTSLADNPVMLVAVVLFLILDIAVVGFIIYRYRRPK